MLALAGACGATDERGGGSDGTGPGSSGAASGTGGSSAFPGSAGTSSLPGGRGSADVCVPGISATSQIPRLLNRQYEAVVRDLLGVTQVGADNKTASQLLGADFDGPMTPDAWRIYQTSAPRSPTR